MQLLSKKSMGCSIAFMSLHSCKSLVVTCIDFRFQDFINNWIAENLEAKDFDRVALAGGVFNWEVISSQIDVSKRLHDISQVILINHEDCGAYGDSGTMVRHRADLREAKQQILVKYPEMQVDCYIAKLSGEFESIE